MDVEAQLSGGNPKSLGNTNQVVEETLKDKSKLNDLFNCLNSNDEIVRMRAGDAIEKVCRIRPDWLLSNKYQLFNDLPQIKQASIQWHLAQIFSEIYLNESDSNLAITILKNNLIEFDDWIVINLTLESLASFVNKGYLKKEEFKEILNKYQNNEHKSVRSRVNKLMKVFKL